MRLLGDLGFTYLLLLLLCKVGDASCGHPRGGRSPHSPPTSQVPPVDVRKGGRSQRTLAVAAQRASRKAPTPNRVSEEELEQLYSTLAKGRTANADVLNILFLNAKELFGGDSAVVKRLDSLSNTFNKERKLVKHSRQKLTRWISKGRLLLRGKSLETYIEYDKIYSELLHLTPLFTERARRILELASHINLGDPTALNFEISAYSEAIPVLSQIWKDSITFHQQFGKANAIAKLIAGGQYMPSLEEREIAQELTNLTYHLDSGRSALNSFSTGLHELIDGPYPIPWALGRILRELLVIDPLCLTSLIPASGLQSRFLPIRGPSRSTDRRTGNLYNDAQAADHMISSNHELMMHYVFCSMPNLIIRLCSRVRNSLPRSLLQETVSGAADDFRPVLYSNLLSVKGVKELLSWLEGKLSGSVSGREANFEKLVKTLRQTAKHNDPILEKLPKILCSYKGLLPEQQMQVQAYVEANKRVVLFLEYLLRFVYSKLRELPWKDNGRHQLARCITRVGSQLMFVFAQLWGHGLLLPPTPNHPVQDDELDGVPMEEEEELQAVNSVEQI